MKYYFIPLFKSTFWVQYINYIILAYFVSLIIINGYIYYYNIISACGPLYSF